MNLSDNKIKKLVNEVQNELENNILKFWIDRMIDNENGGFYGQISGIGKTEQFSHKGAILNARILWTFSSAYRLLKNEKYLEVAKRAKDYIIDNFYDKINGGVYWSLDFKGTPVDRKKQIYALGFVIYGLSEYVRATNDSESLEYAKALFFDLEKYSFDTEKNGYIEALSENWTELNDVRLSLKDANEKKTMNTHLHILEPYTNLYRVWKDERLKIQIENLINVFTTKILNSNTYHLNLFFDEDWNSKYNIVSYGHDIEASWLIHEAVMVLGNRKLQMEVEPVIIKIAKAAREGLNPDGSLWYEYFPDKKLFDKDLHWWVQAENIVGHINLFQNFGDCHALDIALNCWNFIKHNLVDRKNGEWFWSIKADGTVNVQDDKAGFWKCPYHNGRMCLEIIERFKDKVD